ncbi:MULTISPECIES: tRNA glutamyl-Q(34) synthetase GluQRS [unclassified Undibacterium]|uniref:tRNA glutamyl-Q(34) synthetase GluQRS n=1 Tax=unclassified Undibacterium TaxID=2630295 RepID=UPI002AC9DB39|nr:MULTISPECIES: tRNA glutamyl-Q(34) synthetase GluQRS [unclassified Undibacterium]MEB0139588.1 tRNA glutamyl-Q(34) synthetase GluQRS [Undibacterium sp. CCC2.1]MEB0172481.1 tRNA glutamyl-Q(34) synthetase GluQRS [Undibacterium sp. CCC1.1]MEB0176499.1 tRNA glutamyl-Q(34) synthetase GluQRS [Undibacterium sp. CCC3.4]MEB0215647.1 tRNA glutamyl-Q(34) synthetase GluQRS [Undibacterium sp. 5I2]WPX43957.1 tRNA glutamyl-Q(34) synthetase GluQRS [Undibacterium sp. CCC3.4]
MRPPYLGRFAPSPTGPLHMGSLVAAMASYLDARAHQGQWLIRIEDLDIDRQVAGADTHILQSLQRCGMLSHAAVTWQSQRQALYQAAFDQLGSLVYPCACSRKEIADSQRHSAAAALPVYPGTCRNGLATGKRARSWRLRVPPQPAAIISFDDSWYGKKIQDLSHQTGDFILRRGDGFWAYQLAVVVDDGAQGITDVVRGADLIDSTARQIYLQQLLQLPQPRYLHVPVVCNEQGEKLSKQTGALGFDRGDNDLLQEALLPAARHLGLLLPGSATDIGHFWEQACAAWQKKFAIE